jgi:hypothetical protein
MKIKDRIKLGFPREGKYTADQIADIVGLPVREIGTRGYENRTSPTCARYLLQLCKEGFLFQWFIGVGTKGDLTDSAPSWEVFYMWADSELGKTLYETKELKRGYRF